MRHSNLLTLSFFFTFTTALTACVGGEDDPGFTSSASATDGGSFTTSPDTTITTAAPSETDPTTTTDDPTTTSTTTTTTTGDDSSTTMWCPPATGGQGFAPGDCTDTDSGTDSVGDTDTDGTAGEEECILEDGVKVTLDVVVPALHIYDDGENVGLPELFWFIWLQYSPWNDQYDNFDCLFHHQPKYYETKGPSDVVIGTHCKRDIILKQGDSHASNVGLFMWEVGGNASRHINPNTPIFFDWDLMEFTTNPPGLDLVKGIDENLHAGFDFEYSWSWNCGESIKSSSPTK